MIGMDTNALASSIVLVCRPRTADASTLTRREFIRALKAELPEALAHLQRSNIAPVDLAQAAIGPGMSVFTRYARVLDAEGKTLSVREALTLINQTLDEVLEEQEGDFDAATRCTVAWFDEFGFGEGEFGRADVLARAKNTAVSAMEHAGLLTSGGGKVRLLRPEELPAHTPESPPDCVWLRAHLLTRVLMEGGEAPAARWVAALVPEAELVKDLAYRLYVICERRKRPAEAMPYNALVQSWPELLRLSQEVSNVSQQTELFDED